MVQDRSSTGPVRTQFRRYECKYLVPESLAAEIRDYVQPYVGPDPYAAGSPDLSYDICSLYLDSPELKLFWETEEGTLSRIKLRIRSYDDGAEAPVFLEIKRKFNNLILKGRACLDREGMVSLLDGGLPANLPSKADQLACYEEFAGWMARWLAQPMVWVRYRREAYVGSFHSDVRVTMDRQLVCAPARDPLEPAPERSWMPVESRFVVLELKFDAAFPHWMARLIHHFGLQRTSFSKYGKSVKRGLTDPALAPAALKAAAL